MALLPQHFSPAPSSHRHRESRHCPWWGKGREFPLASLLLLLPIATPLPSAKVCATAEKPWWADMATGMCWFCCARQESGSSQVFVSKVLLQGRARNTRLSTFLAYSSVGVHQPCPQHSTNPKLASIPTAALISIGIFLVPQSAAHALWL